MYLFLQIVAILSSSYVLTNASLISKPILVHAIFRHGERTPPPPPAYPLDPYQNETYYPYGFGQLTNDGKRTCYSLGQYLRIRYRHLIRDLYAPNVVYARTTDWERTEMSLQSMLAGLFQPRGIEIWNILLNWQPIPFDIVKQAEDTLLSFRSKPLFIFHYNEYVQNITLQGFFEPYQEVFHYIAENTGLTVTHFEALYFLHFTLTTQKYMGLVLPEWTNAVYPEILDNILALYNEHMTATDALKSAVAGELFQKIVQDTVSKINGSLASQDRSIFLYSGHDMNVVGTLLSLGIDPPELISVGATLLLEVHQRGSIYGFKLYYKKGNQNRLIPLQIPGCPILCPLDTFVSLVEQYYPENI